MKANGRSGQLNSLTHGRVDATLAIRVANVLIENIPEDAF